jgi:hypothetical protein
VVEHQPLEPSPAEQKILSVAADDEAAPLLDDEKMTGT